MELSAEQERARQKFLSWYRSPHKARPYFFLTGPAGSGKSTCVRAILDGIKGGILLAAPTGKAALVISKATGRSAQTIHSLIYKPAGTGGDRAGIEKIEEELKTTDASSDRGRQLSRELKKLMSGVKPMFTLNLDSKLKDAALLVCDECFVKDTLVDTPNGPIAIQNIRPGDKIYNASGIDTVVACSKRKLENAVKITIGNKTITSSKNHVFFTRRGNVFASDLRPDDHIAHTEACMRFLSNNVSAPYYQEWVGSILHSELLLAMANPTAKFSRQVHSGNEKKGRRGSEQVLKVGVSRSQCPDRKNSKSKPHLKSKCLQKDKRSSQSKRICSHGKRWKWERPNQTSKGIASDTGTRMGTGIYFDNGKWLRTSSLQIRYCSRSKKNLYRGRRLKSSLKCSKTSGRKEGLFFGFSRVDSVEILEQGHPELDRYRDVDGKSYLYDIQAKRHHSFSIYGLLVHNCSMIPQEIINDLLSFGTPMLVIGDPFQLPPVAAKPFFKVSEADVCLTEIHRQAKESPIIYLATLAREGKSLPIGRYGDSEVTRNVSSEQALAVDQILVGTHKKRNATNNKLRLLKNFTTELPAIGDRVICKRNNAKYGLMNGAQFIVTEFDRITANTSIIGVENEDMSIRVTCHNELFVGGKVSPWDVAKCESFEFAYSITVHSSQGSQWPSVFVLDESRVFGRDVAAKHLYTALTRAADRALVKLT